MKRRLCVFCGMVVCAMSFGVSSPIFAAQNRADSEMVRSAEPALLAIATLAATDADGDGLSDGLEEKFGTSMHKTDTDGDGVSDKGEVLAGTSPTSSAAILLPKSIRVVLGKQQLERQVAGVTISTHAVSTGKRSTPTPVGTFAVKNKIPRAWSRMAGLWMPYWMDFTGRGYGLHELPEWPGGKKEGQNHLGIPVSHGCIRLGVGDAKLLYDWTPVGTPVVIVR